jgi:hypothetical protein
MTERHLPILHHLNQEIDMLTKPKLRALSPGQWTRVRVPEYGCWQKPGRIKPGDEVDICVVPSYEPRWSHPTYFEWYYRVHYKRPGSDYPERETNEGGLIGPWDFGLFEAYQSRPNWHDGLCTEYHRGKGKFLYRPASDDPRLCSGGDWSRYQCDLCMEYVKPFSNDKDDLICPGCEVTGLVVVDGEQLDRLEQVREFARSIGLLSQFEKQLEHLDNYGCEKNTRQCVLSYDFAPHSFAFAHYRLGKHTADGQRKLWFHGGLIYCGPDAPGDGSFPSLRVNLGGGTGWFCHT